MRPLDAAVDWKFDWANPPQLKLLVDDMYPELKYKYELTNDGALFYSESSGRVSYYYDRGRFEGDNWVSKPEDGFAGRHFNITLEDGRDVTLKGPWSSNASFVISNTELQAVHVTITDKIDVWHRGYTFFAGDVTKEFAEQAIEKFLPGVSLRLHHLYFGSQWVPYPDYNDCEGHGTYEKNGRCTFCGHKLYILNDDGTVTDERTNRDGYEVTDNNADTSSAQSAVIEG